MQVHGTTDNTSPTANCPALLLNSDGSVNTGSGTTAGQVQGNVAAAATDAGNPVKVGGLYSATLPTLTDGQRGNVQLTAKGAAIATMYTAAGNAFSNLLPADGASNAVTALVGASFGETFNGTTWDRVRGNVDTAALITAAGATTSQTGADQTNYNGRGVRVVLDMTIVGTGSVTLTIQGKDAASGKYYTLLAGAAVVTNSTNVYEVYPGVTAAANVSASTTLPRVWRVITTANNANATTYTVGASVIV